MDKAQLLRESAKLIEKGWVRNQFYNIGRYCSLGALRQTAFGSPFNCKASPEFNAATELLAEVMQEQFNTKIEIITAHGQCLIVDANDVRAKNRKEIVACFEKAAMLAEEGR
jgi:hypothetical protein